MRFEDLEHWPVFDVPYEVTDAFGTYTETILSGATDGAKVLFGAPGMIVSDEEWSVDMSVRVVRRIEAYAPKPGWLVSVGER